MTLGYYIKQARIKKGMNQETLAKNCDLTITSISNIENDITKSPQLSTLHRLADALDLKYPYLRELARINRSNHKSNISTLNEIDNLGVVLMFANSLNNLSAEDIELTKLFLSSISSLSEKEKDMLKLLLS